MNFNKVAGKLRTGSRRALALAVAIQGRRHRLQQREDLAVQNNSGCAILAVNVRCTNVQKTCAVTVFTYSKHIYF